FRPPHRRLTEELDLYGADHAVGRERPGPALRRLRGELELGYSRLGKHFMVPRWRMERVGVPRPHQTSIVPSNLAIIERPSDAPVPPLRRAQQWCQRSARALRWHDRNTRNASSIRHAWSRWVAASECDVAYAFLVASTRSPVMKAEFPSATGVPTHGLVIYSGVKCQTPVAGFR